jgi:DNA gyrase subunit A
VDLEVEMERSFLEYAMSVIVSRALPDVRDGLKPVHRRILYAMYDQRILPDRPFVKCARVVGDVMGRFHPHGDAAIYDALVRMVQDFSLRHPLIEGHGSFGSTSPEDGPAAMRYTECRLARISLHMLEGIDEETVDMVPNYDGSEAEPTVLPSRFPNLLVNGSQGIAVGMATNIPPHNLGEVIDATVYMLEHPEATSEELMRFIKGPDFPTGARIVGVKGIREAYLTGRGSVRLRAVAEIKEHKGSHRIEVTEFPYQTSPEQVAAKIAELVKAGELQGIAHIQNASAGRQPKLVIDLKREANPQVVLNNLYKNTPMQTTFPANMLALVDGVPRLLNLSQLIGAYVDHQIEVVRRRSQFRLRKARERLHIVEGLLRAISMLDEVIEAIKTSEDRAEARRKLTEEPFSFSEVQANHILDMTLARLTRLGTAELQQEKESLLATIEDLEEILANDSRLRRVISEELREIKERFADERRTEIVAEEGEVSIEDLVADEEIVITLSRAGYIKASAADAFRRQGRGGKGVRGASLKEEDLLEHVLYTSKHAHLLFFTALGKVYTLRGYEVPSKERTARGIPIVNLLPLAPGDSVQAIVDARSFGESEYLMFATKRGMVKKTALSEYSARKRDGLRAIVMKEGDELVSVFATEKDDDVLCVSRKGMAIRFPGSEVRPSGRATQGVLGMRLAPDDEVVTAVPIKGPCELLLITDAGYGKRVRVSEIRRQGRGGRGILVFKVGPKRGSVTRAFVLEDGAEVIAVSTAGAAIRVATSEISRQSRYGTGIRLMTLEPDQSLAAAALVPAGG